MFACRHQCHDLRDEHAGVHLTLPRTTHLNIFFLVVVCGSESVMKPVVKLGHETGYETAYETGHETGP